MLDTLVDHVPLYFSLNRFLLRGIIMKKNIQKLLSVVSLSLETGKHRSTHQFLDNSIGLPPEYQIHDCVFF